MAKINPLNRHLIETGENYFEHFLFAFSTAMWILAVSLVLTVHSIFPFFFTTTASRNIRKINEVMQKRVAKLMERRNSKELVKSEDKAN